MDWATVLLPGSKTAGGTEASWRAFADRATMVERMDALEALERLVGVPAEDGDEEVPL